MDSKNVTKYMRITGVFVLLIGIIVGIISANNKRETGEKWASALAPIGIAMALETIITGVAQIVDNTDKNSSKHMKDADEVPRHMPSVKKPFENVDNNVTAYSDSSLVKPDTSDMIECPQCGAEQKANRSICFCCGYRFIQPKSKEEKTPKKCVYCPQCGAKNNAVRAFCIECGSKLE